MRVVWVLCVSVCVCVCVRVGVGGWVDVRVDVWVWVGAWVGGCPCLHVCTRVHVLYVTPHAHERNRKRRGRISEGRGEG